MLDDHLIRLLFPYHGNGKLQNIGSYIDSTLNGDYLIYDSSGVQIDSFQYDMGKLIKNPGDPVVDRDDEEMPHFIGCEHIADREERAACGNQKMLEYIYASIRPEQED